MKTKYLYLLLLFFLLLFGQVSFAQIETEQDSTQTEEKGNKGQIRKGILKEMSAEDKIENEADRVSDTIVRDNNSDQQIESTDTIPDSDPPELPPLPVDPDDDGLPPLPVDPDDDGLPPLPIDPDSENFINDYKITEDEQKLYDDLKELRLPNAKKLKVDISYSVELVPKQTKVSGWAAGAAMIVSWRDGVKVSQVEIASGIGYWKQYNKTGYSVYDKKMFTHWGLKTITAPQEYPVSFFAAILENGPLLVMIHNSISNSTSPVVVAGMRGDGTPEGTLVTIYDSKEKGMKIFKTSNKGAIYTMTYKEFNAARKVIIEGLEKPSEAVYIAY